MKKAALREMGFKGKNNYRISDSNRPVKTSSDILTLHAESPFLHSSSKRVICYIELCLIFISHRIFIGRTAFFPHIMHTYVFDIVKRKS